MTGDILGTLRYMSPEQALAKRVVIDHRTDIYSLGATLYELLTLHPVFEGDDRQELLRQIAFAEPRPLRKLNPAMPRELETIVLKALAKDPSSRATRRRRSWPTTCGGSWRTSRSGPSGRRSRSGRRSGRGGTRRWCGRRSCCWCWRWSACRSASS